MAAPLNTIRTEETSFFKDLYSKKDESKDLAVTAVAMAALADAPKPDLHIIIPGLVKSPLSEPSVKSELEGKPDIALSIHTLIDAKDFETCARVINSSDLSVQVKDLLIAYCVRCLIEDQDFNTADDLISSIDSKLLQRDLAKEALKEATSLMNLDAFGTFSLLIDCLNKQIRVMGLGPK